MKFRRTICLILCAMVLFSLLVGVSAEASDPSVIAGCHSVDAALPIGGTDKIADTAKAVILYERKTGTLVYAYKPDEKIYPASMVKLMTAVVALEQGNPDDVVTVKRSTLDTVAIGSVSAGLVNGEEITLRDLLYCMMVASANDAAAVIAEHISGSQESFVTLMNQKAAAIGCKGTNFTNAHGLHEKENYTTARDILKILEHGLQNPEFKAMFETVSYTVPATNKSPERIVTTTNNMMTTEPNKKYYDERVTGGKTGATDKAGRCLAVTANVGDMELIGIVMGAKPKYSEDGSYLTKFGSFEEMDDVLDYAEKHFECRQLFYKDQVIAQYPVAQGKNNVVTTPETDGFTVLPKDMQASQLQWKYSAQVEGLQAPVMQGQDITAMEVWHGDICLASTRLVAMKSVGIYEPYTVPKGDAQEQEEEEHGEIIAMILGVVLGATVVIIVGMFLSRVIQTAVIKAKIHRRRKNRRRNRNA